MKGGLTGIKDVDFEILEKLNDNELGKVCSVNSHIRQLCNDENFWRKRTISKFGKYFCEDVGNKDLQKCGKKINEYRENIPWKEYYSTLRQISDSISNFTLKYIHDYTTQFDNIDIYYFTQGKYKSSEIYYFPDYNLIKNPGYNLFIHSVMNNTQNVVFALRRRPNETLLRYNDKVDSNVIFAISVSYQISNDDLINKILSSEDLKVSKILEWLPEISRNNEYYLGKILKNLKERGVTIEQMYSMYLRFSREEFHNSLKLKEDILNFINTQYTFDVNVLINLLSQNKYSNLKLLQVYEILK